MDLKNIVAKLRGDMRPEEFGPRVGVSHTAVRQWEGGANIGRLGRKLLLEYAERVGAPKNVVRALRREQPKVEHAR